jgi:thermitase
MTTTPIAGTSQTDYPEGKYYVADGKRIPLTPSHHFVAVRPTEAGQAPGESVARLASALGGSMIPAQVFDLPEYNLAVIRVPDVPSTEAVGIAAPDQTVRSLVGMQPTVTSGPQVYETDEPTATPGLQEALIPVGEVLVHFAAGTSDEARQELLQKNHVEVRQVNYPEPGTYLVAITDDQDAVDVANRLHESELVEFAQPNFLRLTPRLAAVEIGGRRNAPLDAPPLTEDAPQLAILPPTEVSPAEVAPAPEVPLGPAAPPTDPNFASQWGLKKIKAPEAWDISMGSSAISIAVIDEGCDLAHEDLVYKGTGYDAFDGDTNPTPSGNDAHGTACAGIAAMRANNGRGGAGVAPNCRVLPIRIAKGVGGGFWSTTDAKVADGIRKAVDGPPGGSGGADVLSNSYQVSQSTVVTNAFKHAQTNGRAGKGCPTAAATGNGDVLGVIYPARLSPTIRGFMAVGASNEWDQRKSKTSLDGETWWGSNYGPEVDVVAPGVHIFTSDITGGAGYGSGNYVPNFNGTSSATPHVAGLMALILSVDPDLRSWEVEDIVKLSADDLGAAGRDQFFGFGRINARRALEAASRISYQVSVVPEFIGAGKECFMRMNVRMYNPGINQVRLDALTITSQNPTRTAEIDRFEYRPNPGGVMAPRSSQDVRLNRILLKANGTQASWSYRWALSWSYTFWRPSAPAFPLGAGVGSGTPAAETEERKATANPIHGGADGPKHVRRPEEVPHPSGDASAIANGQNLATLSGDLISIDRHSKSITITIR